MAQGVPKLQSFCFRSSERAASQRLPAPKTSNIFILACPAVTRCLLRPPAVRKFTDHQEVPLARPRSSRFHGFVAQGATSECWRLVPDQRFAWSTPTFAQRPVLGGTRKLTDVRAIRIHLCPPPG